VIPVLKQLASLTASDAAQLIARREISSVELTKACLARIHDRNPDVAAWRFIDEKTSLAAAEVADKTDAKTPLHGIPFGVKDVIDTAEFPTECGTVIHAGRRPRADASCVSIMRKAGAVLLGKLVTTEYAVYSPNETRHPLNLAHTPGGSSSGSAAAVADMQVPIAFGNQTAGSLIRPAAFCGIFALKPTHGLVDQRGILPLQPFFDTLGYMARTIDDLQAFFGTVTETSQIATWDENRVPNIGICKTFQWQYAKPETRFVFQEVANQLRAHGIKVTELQLPEHFADLPITHQTMLHKGISDSLRADYDRAKNQMSERLRSMVEAGANMNVTTYEKQRSFAEECRASINTVLADYDAILCPSTPGEAPVGIATGDPVFQVVWTLLGVPCINLPVATGPRGLPIGIQLIGKRHADAQLLAVARHLMQTIRQIRMVTAVRAFC
jgi:Asp-tRNA(Asn)/Glu-tRNA(Gln) amidotransferase A subunit family amidase